MNPYRSAKPLAQAAIVLVAMQLVLDAFVAVACCLALADPEGGSLRLFASMGGGAMLSGGLYIAAVVVFMCWVYRSVANLGALGSYSMFKPSSAVWAFFIPFVNMARPHTVVATIWTESQPAVVSETGYSLRQPTTVVTTWWTLVVISTIFSRLFARNASDREWQLVAIVIESALWIATGLAFIYMVRRTQQRQDAQWQDLELRRAAPRPDASLLR